MRKEFHKENRQRLYKGMQKNSLLIVFSGKAKRKTGDEDYPFYTNRDFLYLTGLDSHDFIFMAQITDSEVREKVYILPPDAFLERWTGTRIKPDEAYELSAIEDVAFLQNFERDFHNLASSGNFKNIYFDFDKLDMNERDDDTYLFQKKAAEVYPFLNVLNVHPNIKKLRTIKRPCEIEAMKKAEIITKEGIVAMMKASKPGMYEYQYKAEFDYALGQHGPQGSAFPSIISAGKNNFCIHYYSYKGVAAENDMILNDVGAWYDGLMNDVSRGWPCNGRYNDRQKLLYNCAYNTSEHMFSIIKPGMKMADVDKTIREYNFEQLKEAGVLDDYRNIGTYMWHAGAHHVGYDVHDDVEMPEIIARGMVFCIDIGIYHEEWGIGFRLEDNCLVTEGGCENLSAATPRTIKEIEDTMKKGYF
ncbi:M24 family metallopeptidase [Clostridium oryzae]|uniref:Xaa-Pro aminopeptidase n=1 Tax=Clostridium oryzae TaxID=1450648 RepID=A0A1V4IDX5_9CLOT|nr:Xaa-Pro peptidase family protein [Clostridium oryzae]OPJ58054.1 Xaa-Pro aminopeptidase [Clostridium oryzae]